MARGCGQTSGKWVISGLGKRHQILFVRTRDKSTKSWRVCFPLPPHAERRNQRDAGSKKRRPHTGIASWSFNY